MVANAKHIGLRGAAVAAGFAFFAMAASPAAAQGNNSVAQVATSVHAANETQAPLGEGDKEFRELYANWKSHDGGLGFATPEVRTKVAIPSGMPLSGSRMSSSYGMRNHPILNQRRAHKGIDLAAPTGTPVYATADGVVSMAQYYSTYGNYVQIEHGGEMQTRFAHLSSYTVHDGESVHKGDLIGYVGTTGRSTGPHLHYEVRINGESVNPTAYMDEPSSNGRNLMVADARVGQ